MLLVKVIRLMHSQVRASVVVQARHTHAVHDTPHVCTSIELLCASGIGQAQRGLYRAADERAKVWWTAGDCVPAVS